MTLHVAPFEEKDADKIGFPRTPFEHFMFSSNLVFPSSPGTFLRYYAENNSPEHRFFSVFSENEYVGHFEMKNIRNDLKIGTGAHIALSSAFRRMGFGVRFINMVSQTGFIDLALHRISLTVLTVNKSAIAAYIRAGYHFEGVLRELMEFSGRRYSAYQMGMVRHEWEDK